jgi:hypothetical protein
MTKRAANRVLERWLIIVNTGAGLVWVNRVRGVRAGVQRCELFSLLAASHRRRSHASKAASRKISKKSFGIRIF